MRVEAWLAGRWGWVAVAVIVLLGLILRLVSLGEIPLGLHHDEGFNALDALDILAGSRPIFLAGNNGREPLFIYLTAASMALFGPTAWAIRLPGALAGALAILAQYLLVSRLPLPRPRLTALFSAVLVAITFWPLAKGHQGLRAGLLPVWVALMLWAWWRSLDPDYSRKTSVFRLEWLVWSALTGVFVAGAVYTHLTGRILPLILLASAVWEVVRRRQLAPLAGLGVALATVGLFTAPLLTYFADHPDMLGYRAAQVSVFDPAMNQGNMVGALVDNAWRLALMPVVRGTDMGWENLAGRPVFDPLIGVAFLLGVVWLGRDLLGRRGPVAQSAAVLLTVALGVMLTPSWLSDVAPHYGRLTGIWPVLFLLPAVGLVIVGEWLARRGQSRWAWAGVAAILVASGVWSAWDFWGRYAWTPEIHDTYRGAELARGAAVAQLVAAGPTYVTPAVWSHTPIRLVNYQSPPRSFDPRHGLVLPPQGDAQYVFEGWEAKDADQFAKRWPGITPDPANGQTDALLLIYRLTRPQFPQLKRLSIPVSFGEAIQLTGYQTEALAKPGDELHITFEWLALGPTPVDHNLFVHLVSADGTLLGQTDSAPLGGSYPTNVWAAGETILDTLAVRIPPDGQPGMASLRVGWYDWRSGVRLAAPGHADNAVELGRLRIE